jgi:LuxR family quorum sensing-dependent transcriptional regulator
MTLAGRVTTADAAAFEVPPIAPRLDEYTGALADARTPAEVLDALDAFAKHLLPIHAHGAARFPQLAPDWCSARLGRDVLLHSSVPLGWWEEYIAMARRESDTGLTMLRASLTAFTWTETMQTLDPIGIDRWPYELSVKYGIRDLFACAVGRRWIVAFWSPRPLGKELTQPLRIVLFAAAGFAALRLEQLIDSDPRWVAKRAKVTPRELAVLRLLSMGRQTAEIATVLGLGEETVRSHLKKAQAKLGVRNRTHAVSEAIRQQLIP